MSQIVIPVPHSDFDPTEAGVPWKLLEQNQVKVVFATPDGQVASGDPRLLIGRGLGPWSPWLMADSNGRQAYQEMIASRAFRNPIRWDDMRAHDFDGVVLPGGHAPGMKHYLESVTLQKAVSDFFESSKLVGAICHGVVLAARSKDRAGKSSLAGRTATSLLRTQELAAWALTGLCLGNYYRTYPETVQAEVTRHLGNPKSFRCGPFPLKRDSMDDLEAGFVVEDGNFVSARWPGDAHRFARTLVRRLIEN